MKLKKLSATFDDREHGEKARPLGPEVKKRDVTAARDDYSSYLLSNQQANQQQDDDDVVPPPIPDPPVQEAPQLPESYRQAVDAFENAIALQGGNMDTSGDGALDVLDVAGIIDFFMTVVAQSVEPGGSLLGQQFQGLFWNNAGQMSFLNNAGLFFNPGESFNGTAAYYEPTEDGIGESLLTWSDYMASEAFNEENLTLFYPIPLDWNNPTPNQYTSALQAVFDAYQGNVPDDFFDTLLMNPQPTEADLEDLGAWFDANMLPIMNIYADVYMSNVAGDPLGYSDTNFQDMMNYIESQGQGIGNFDVSINDTDYNPFSGNIFDVNNDGTFNGADIAAWADFTEMVSAVTNGTDISEANNIFTQDDIDQIIEYYAYYGTEMAGGNLYFSTNGEWDDTQNLFNINNPTENPPLIFNLLDQGDVDAYVEEQEADEILQLQELNWANQRPTWGENYGLPADLQSETPDWYIAFANSFSTWMSNGYDANYTQDSPNYNTWAGQGPNAQVEAYQSQIASWISANFFDPDGDTQYNPLDLDNSVVEFLINNHPQVNQLSDITPEVFGEALNIMPQLLNECSDWVNSVGGIPEWANIIGQENTEPFNHLAQNAALLFLATSFGHQNLNADPTAQGPDGFDYSYESLFEYLGYDSEQASSLASYVQSEDGFVADQAAFSNWLYTGFMGLVGYFDPNTGESTIMSPGMGVIWAPAGWELGDDYDDYAYYQGQGPALFDVQFYNFELDLTSSEFLFTYNAFIDSTPFYTPPPPPNLSINPSEGVEGIYGDAPTPGAEQAGEYIDIPDFLNRTGGMIDFDGDGNVGFGDFLAVYAWILQGAYNNYNGLSWPMASFYAGNIGIGWSAFYATQNNFSNQALYNLTSSDLWYGGFMTPGDLVLNQQGLLSNSLYSYGGLNPFMYEGAEFGESGPYTGFNPAYALAYFLVFQYANDYIDSGGQTPNWFTTLMEMNPNSPLSTADWFNLIDPNWVNITEVFSANSFAGDDGGNGGLFGSLVVPLLQAILPDENALNSYSDFYLQNGIDPNEFFVPAGPYTGPDSLVPIIAGAGSLGDGLEDALAAASSANFISEYAIANPVGIAAIDFNGDGQINTAEINLYGQLYQMIVAALPGAAVDGQLSLNTLAIELMGPGASTFSLVNNFVTSMIMSGEASDEAAALYSLFGPFIQLGVFGVETDVDISGMTDIFITFGTTVNLTTAQYFAQIFGNPNNTQQGGLIGVIADSLIEGAYYIGPDGNFIQVNNIYAGLQAQAFHTANIAFQLNGTTPPSELAFSVFLYPQLLEFIEQFDDPDLNNDGFYTEADVTLLLELLQSGDFTEGSPEFDALDLTNDGDLDESDLVQFVDFFGSFAGDEGEFQFGQFGYFDDGVWVDFDYDDFDQEDYFGDGWSPQGYAETGEAPPPIPTT